MRNSTFPILLTLVFILQPSSFILFLHAQDFERIAPKTPEKSEGKTKLPEQPVPKEEGDEKVLVDKLKGLIFLSSPKQVTRDGVRDVKGVQVVNLKLLESSDFRKQFESYLGQPVSLKSLNRLSRNVILFYRQNDRPIVDVSVPEQDITTGVVQIVVVEGRLGQLKTEGNRWFDSKMLKSQVRLREGEVVSEKQLTEDLNWLNGNPFRQVSAVFSPGEEPGRTDLVLKTQDRFPVRFYGGWDDSGNDLTGDERWTMGLNWGDAFGLDQQFNYQFTGDSHMTKMVAHSGSWIIPLPWRHRLTFFGSFAETTADLPLPFNLNGKSWQTSVRYAVPLPSFGPYSHEWTGGWDFKRSNNNLEFGGANVFNTTTEVAQWVFEYNSRLKDDWGATSFGAALIFSPGGTTELNKDIFFSASRRSALAEYMYEKLSVERATKLPWDFTWTVKGSYQFADGNLLGSEQLGLGGYSSVRGYDEREANGDEGYLISTEIRTPPVSLGALVGIEGARDQLQFLGFYDYGSTYNRILLPGEDPHIQLAGAGPGLRYSISPWFTLRFDYGWQLYDTGLNTRYNSRAHIGIVLAY